MRPDPEQLELELKELISENLDKDTFTEKFLNDHQAPTKSEKSKACYNLLDLWLVLMHTFLYVANYYGLASTASGYTKSLQIQDALSGIIQAVTPAAATIAGFIFNYFSKSNKYFNIYMFLLPTLIISNLLYYLAETVHVNHNSKLGGLVFLIIGRMFLGIGGSRLISRKFLAINVQVWAQSKYSAIFVGTSALGMTLGPGFSSILQFIPQGTFIGTQVRQYNVMAGVMFLIWIGLFLIFIFRFQGYDKKKGSKDNLQRIKYEEYIMDQRILTDKDNE